MLANALLPLTSWKFYSTALQANFGRPSGARIHFPLYFSRWKFYSTALQANFGRPSGARIHFPLYFSR
jgi:hypothetical protein